MATAVAAVNDAMPKFRAQGSAHLAGVVISLGSNDVADQTTLVTRWLGLIDYLRANCPDITNTTPIIVTGGVEPAIGDGTVTRAAAELAASQRNNVYVEHPPYPTADPNNLHPTLDEARTWGASLAELFRAVETTGQAIPTFTMLPEQGSTVGEPLSVTITHTGLTDRDKYGVVAVTGGADADLFEIGGTFFEPRLVEKHPGTLTARTYDV